MRGGGAAAVRGVLSGTRKEVMFRGRNLNPIRMAVSFSSGRCGLRWRRFLVKTATMNVPRGGDTGCGHQQATLQDAHALLRREHIKPASRKSEWPHRSPASQHRMPGAPAAPPPALAAPTAMDR